MVIVKKRKNKVHTYVYGYNINEEDPKDFEYFIRIYSDKNRFNKEQVLCDALLIRCSLTALIQKVFCSQETLEEILQNNFKSFIKLKNIIQELPQYEVIQASLPYRVHFIDKGCPKGFNHYRCAYYPLTVTVEPHENFDFSRIFQDFDKYQEKAVDEVLKVFDDVKSTYGLTEEEIEKKLTENVESRQEPDLN